MVFAHFCIQSSPEPGVMLINHIIEQLTVLYLVNKEESMEVENREKCWCNPLELKIWGLQVIKVLKIFSLKTNVLKTKVYTHFFL